MHEIDVRAVADAPAADVWALLDDSASWPRRAPIETCEIEREAGPGVTEEFVAGLCGRARAAAAADG